MRALTRAREDALSAGKEAQCRRKAFWRRHDIRATGRATGGPAPLRWLAAVIGPPPAQHIVFQDYVRAVTAPTARRQRLAQARHAHGPAWRLPAVVEALQALRGVPCPVAVTMVAAIGALPRVAPPRERMQCLGLIPAAYASGERRQQGALTQAGHTHARRALVEGAWAYRSPAQGSRHLQLRLAKHPTRIQDISWKAQGRWGTRSRQLVARGPQAPLVTVAMARELAGFLGAMAQPLPVAAAVSRTERPCTLNSAGVRRASQEAQPRCGGPLDGVKRRVEDTRA
jgi:transposase